MNGKAKSEAIRQRLNELADNGRLTPNDVVEDARRKESPLHECFEWNDKIAGQKFRIVQARGLIERFTMPVVEGTQILVAPFAVRDPAARQKEQGYVRTVDLATDRDRARAALMSEIGRIESYLTRAQSLALAFGMESEVSGITARVHAFREQLAAA